MKKGLNGSPIVKDNGEVNSFTRLLVGEDALSKRISENENAGRNLYRDVFCSGQKEIYKSLKSFFDEMSLLQKTLFITPMEMDSSLHYREHSHKNSEFVEKRGIHPAYICKFLSERFGNCTPEGSPYVLSSQYFKGDVVFDKNNEIHYVDHYRAYFDLAIDNGAFMKENSKKSRDFRKHITIDQLIKSGSR